MKRLRDEPDRSDFKAMAGLHAQPVVPSENSGVSATQQLVDTGILPMQYACTECGNTVRKEQSSILCPHCDAGPIHSSCALQHICPLGSRYAGNFMAEQPADQEGQQTLSDSEGSKMEDGEARVFSASALARQFAEQLYTLTVGDRKPKLAGWNRMLKQSEQLYKNLTRASLPTPMRPRTNPDLNGGFNGRKMLAWMLTH